MIPPVIALYLSVAVLVISLCMLAAANGTVMLKHGFGASTTEIGVWRTCEATADGGEKCYSVTSNSQCSELSSRMKAVGAFSILGIVSTILCVVAFVVESRGVTFPVNHLTKAIFAWAVVLTVVCIAVCIGTLVASLCSDPLPMTDRNGSFGTGFYFLFAAIVLQVVGGAAYAFFRLKHNPTADNDDHDDKEDGFNDL
jgi:hypothetical protein